MTQPFSSPVVVCRPALPCDTADVKEFCKFTWDGHDYVQYAWDSWLADPEGILAVAEYAGHAIALAKVTLLAPGQWWLEGFRVDPKFQGQKIGSHIHNYVDTWWLEHGGGVVRLMAGSQRVQVHHLCEKFGYNKIGEVAGFVASPLDESLDSFQLMHEDEILEAIKYAESSSTISLGDSLIDLGWRFVTPNPTTFRELIKEKLAWWWRGREGLLLAWVDEGEPSEEDRLLAIGLTVCQTDMLPEFLMDVRKMAAQLGYDQAFWIVPQQENVETILRQTGFERLWDRNVFVYEKRHPLSGTGPTRL